MQIGDERTEDTKPREQDSMQITHWVVGSKTKHNR